MWGYYVKADADARSCMIIVHTKLEDPNMRLELRNSRNANASITTCHHTGPCKVADGEKTPRRDSERPRSGDIMGMVVAV